MEAAEKISWDLANIWFRKYTKISKFVMKTFAYCSTRNLLYGAKKKNRQSIIQPLFFPACRLDHTEYTCLKALVLFQPDLPGLQHQLQIEVLQDQTHIMLQVGGYLISICSWSCSSLTCPGSSISYR
jgi:hypothetical protein